MGEVTERQLSIGVFAAACLASAVLAAGAQGTKLIVPQASEPRPVEVRPESAPSSSSSSSSQSPSAPSSAPAPAPASAPTQSSGSSTPPPTTARNEPEPDLVIMSLQSQYSYYAMELQHAISQGQTRVADFIGSKLDELGRQLREAGAIPMASTPGDDDPGRTYQTEPPPIPLDPPVGTSTQDPVDAGPWWILDVFPGTPEVSTSMPMEGNLLDAWNEMLGRGSTNCPKGGNGDKPFYCPT